MTARAANELLHPVGLKPKKGLVITLPGNHMRDDIRRLDIVASSGTGSMLNRPLLRLLP